MSKNTKKSKKKQNPLQSVQLASLDLLNGQESANLEILSAVKKAQVQFLNYLEQYDSEKITPAMVSCGNDLVYLRYPATGERLFAYSDACGSPYCLLCQYQKAYASAVSVYDYVYKQVQANPRYFPFFAEISLVSDFPVSRLSVFYPVAEEFYQALLADRSEQSPEILGSAGGYYLTAINGKWGISLRELRFLQRPDSLPAPVDFRQIVFPQILHIMLCSVINAEGKLTYGQQREAIENREQAPTFVSYGCFDSLKVPEVPPVTQQDLVFHDDVVGYPAAVFPGFGKVVCCDRKLGRYICMA